MMKAKITYVWKELTDDGLLKEPRKFGPYYDEVLLNGYSGGFSSKDEAIAEWIRLKEAYTFEVPSSLVLVEEYSLVKED